MGPADQKNIKLLKPISRCHYKQQNSLSVYYEIKSIIYDYYLNINMFVLF